MSWVGRPVQYTQSASCGRRDLRVFLREGLKIRKPACTVYRMFGLSIPMPNALVATSMGTALALKSAAAFAFWPRRARSSIVEDFPE